MDLYDLFMMEAVSQIGNGLLYPRPNQQSEANFRNLLYAGMSRVIQNQMYVNLFSYNQTNGSVFTSDTPKYYGPNYLDLINYSNNIYQNNYDGQGGIAEDYFQPDILVHNYDTYFHQHISIEIKVSAQYEEFKKDICKLLGYINILGYRRAYLIFSFKQPTRVTVEQKIRDILTRLLPTEMPNEGGDRLFLIFPTHISLEQNIWTCVPFLDLQKIIRN